MNTARHKHFTTRQTGLSLIELMVAMVIGLILIAGVIEIYVNSKQTYRDQDALSRLQENGRYALSILTTNVRPAGFSGCGNIDSVEPNVIATGVVPSSFAADSAVTGSEYKTSTWDPALPVALGANVLANTDILTVSRAGDCGATVTGNLAPTNANIQVNGNNTCGFKTDQVLMVSDCTAADVFRVVNNPTTGSLIQTVTHSKSSNNANVLSKLYQQDAEVLTFSSETYFIRNGTSGIPSLWVLDNTQATVGNNPLELVEGVENMQVEYALDAGSDGVPDSYAAADVAKANWDKVVAVRVRLLLRTIENVNAPAYSFNGVNYTGGFLRQEMTATIKLRNRGLM
ncbi:type IV pilus assembly protein PilW [gamma proteobacterium IMCC2047]|nr:type IV pilus assembly protein PilW [gamma proteobacterium IMCC2047]